MTDLIFELKKLEHCPLCHKKWITYEEAGRNGRAYFVCKSCMISIWVRDPMVGKWGDYEAVPCPTCGHHKMNFFSRSDGYMKFKCPKCPCTIEEAPNSMNDEINKDQEIKPGELLKIGCEYPGCPEFLRISGDKTRDEKTLQSHGWMMCAEGQNPWKIYCRFHAEQHCARHKLDY